MSASELPSPADPRPEAVIAGTLCLMSCYVQHPVPLYADRVAANLAQMAEAAAFSPELRTICRRLAERWDAIRADARQRVAAGEPSVDQRAFH
jgi:hypothetical protein